MKMNRLFAAALGLFAWSASALADGMIIVRPDRERRPPGLQRNFPLEVKFHRVKVDITGQVTVTAVDQVFHNPTPHRLEGTYIFPVPVGASISRFDMDIDGKPVKGEILDKDKARQIYEDIVRRSEDPALLEYIGTGMVQLRIFPIEPRSDKRIRLKYSEVLSADRGLVSYRYPLNTEKFSAKPLDEVSIEVSIKESAAISSVYSPTHPVAVTRPDGQSAVARWEAKGVRPNQDFLLSYLRSTESVGLTAVTYKRAGDKEGWFSFVIAPNIKSDKADILPKDVLFVLDVSGSMLEGDKIGQARKALAYCLGRLGENDRFNLIDFSTEVRTFRDSLVAASAEMKAAATKYVKDLEASGGTNIDEALQKALAMTAEGKDERPFIVVFVTDGQPTIGERNIASIITNVSKATKRAFRLFSVGVGTDLNTHLLDDLANRHKGTSLYIAPGEDLEVKISNFYEKIAYPVLADLKLSVDGVQIRDAYPRPLPDLFKGQELVVLGRYQGAGSQAIVLEGVYAGQRRKFVFETTFADGATPHDYLPHLWAKRKVGYLMDQVRLHGENPEIKKEVISLSKQYGIMTPYTSFLVLEDERQLGRDRPKGEPSPPASRAFGGGKPGQNAPAEGGERMREQTGGRAVDAAREVKKLKEKDRLGDDEQNDGKDDSGERLVQRVGDKTFYRHEGAWVDSVYDAAKMKDKLKKVTYLSKEYFDLLAANPELGRYLALGKALIVVTAKGEPIQVVAK